ncbi:MAG: hypothetical protein M0026_09430 [Nocardiopsaceae bacterium]|nr:hypothetical protein [Nocardiopsaceae bacterium]
MLRHLIGLLAGLAIAPPLWAGIAWSAAEVGAVLESGASGNLNAPMAVTAVGTLMTVGLVCGVLTGARVSPLSAFVSGGLVLALCLWPIMNPASLNAVFPDWIPDLFHPLGPALPIALPLGTLLFISAVLPSRWAASAPSPAALPPMPPSGTVIASVSRDRDTPREAEPEPAEPEDTPVPAPAPAAVQEPEAGPPEKTTTPFQRWSEPRWEPLDEPADQTRELERDDRH